MEHTINDLPWDDPLLLDEEGLSQENEALRMRLEEASRVNEQLNQLIES